MLWVNLLARRGRLFHGGEIWFQKAKWACLLTQPRQYIERFDPSWVFRNTFNFGIYDLKSRSLQEGGHGGVIEKVQVLVALYETQGRNMVQAYASRGGVEVHGDQSHGKMQQSVEVTAVKPVFSRKADPVPLIGNTDA